MLLLFPLVVGMGGKKIQKRNPSQNDVDLLANVKPASEWIRGNTHTHTVLSGHGDAKPESVVEWYYKRGYQFLILSEHNKFIDPQKVKLPKNKRSDFFLIPGVELTGHNNIHTTAMNVKEVIKHFFPELLKPKNAPKNGPILDRYLENVQNAGGEMILNHPNYMWAVDVEDIFYVEELVLFELYNGHPEVHNYGLNNKISTEVMWDELLTRGKKIFAVASDDAHYFHRKHRTLSNPGRGWVMVNAPDLTPDSVVEALRKGQFYASSGVFLKEYKIEQDQLIVEIDKTKTEKEMMEGDVLGRVIKEKTRAVVPWVIEFIGPKGVVLQKTIGTEAVFTLSAEHFSKNSYVRAKITHERPVNGQIESFYAWANPIFSR